MANRFPLIVDTADSNKIKEIPSGDNLQLSGNSIVGAVNITASGTLTIESINATNISKGGFPLATVATSGQYSDLAGTPTNISVFTNDSNYVTTGSNVSVLTNDAGYLTTVAFGDLTSTPTTLSGYGITDAATSAQGTLADSAIQPGSNISTLNNDAGYITVAQIQAGDLTVDVNNSGDLIGSVFGQDSTILVDAILSSVNLDGTIRGHVVPHANEVYDLGSASNRFRDLYLSGSTINLGGVAISLNPATGTVSLPIDASASLGLPANIGIDGFYGLTINFADNAHPIDPSASTAISPNPDLVGVFGPLYAYSKIVFATPVPGYGAGIEFDYFNFPDITDNGKTPPTIVADIDGGGNLLSLEITATGDATGLGESLGYYPTGDSGSVNAGGVELQDASGAAPIVTAPGGKIAGYLSIAELQVIVAASTSFADFQSRIAAL